MRFNQYRQLALLYSNRVARIYRARDKTSDHPVFLKVANQERGHDVVTLFRHDYELCETAPASYRLEPIEFYSSSEQTSAVFNDPGGDPLERWANRSDWPLHQRLDLAIRLVGVLEAIHQEGFIHKDFNPRNILFNVASRDPCLLDFSLSTGLSHEQAGLTNFGIVDGNPAYCAPEQTGRMNRSMDIRSDYYGLGATLYQLFTGTAPFLLDSPMELVHAQIAKAPEPPDARAPGIPPILGSVILKLMEKVPEDRYQSLEGLRHDLDRIAQALSEQKDPEPFPLGEDDYPADFYIPRNLYSREAPRQSLMAGFEQAVAGREAITLVAGPSGIGKTALIRDLYEPITARHGYFISGKFDQLQRERPYTALMEAFQQLFRDLLSAPEEQLSQWRSALHQALGDSSALLTPLIPELEAILGTDNQVPNLPPDEKSRVFNRIMIRMTALFCSPERPFVLYLDDLQWADPASLDLLELFARDLADQHFYLIGAYRDNEITGSHPLLRLFESLKDSTASYRHIVLEPLDEEAVVQILADSLRQPPTLTQELARGIRHKTGGVPFFIHQSLEALYRQGLIVPVRGSKCWYLAAASLDELPATENQVEWMAAQIRQFKPHTQQLLQSAACMGNRFDLNALCQLEQLPLEQLMNELEEPLRAGLISVSRNALAGSIGGESRDQQNSFLTGRFAHDRIQQAAYSMLSEAEQRQRHWQMGQLLMEGSTLEEQDAQLFELVHHLNLGRAADCDRVTRWEIARLNCRAGEKAHNSAAHNASYRLYSEGIALLPPDAWSADYPLTLKLHSGGMHTAFLSRHYEEMERLGDVILANARDLLDTKMVYTVRIEAKNVRNRPDQAVETALPFLQQLGLRFPERPTNGHILLSLAHTQFLLRRRSVESLRNMPEMTDPRQLAAVEVLYRAASSAYFASPKLYPLLMLKMVRLAAKHGHAPEYTSAFAPYGIVLCGVLHDYERGFEIGELALELARNPRARALQCRTTVLIHTFVWHWKRYAGEGIQVFADAYEDGLETGDHEYAAYAGALIGITSLFVGRGLEQVEALFERYEPDIARLSASTAYTFLRVYAQMVSNLRHETDCPWRLNGRYMAEETLALECDQDRSGLSCLRTAQLIMRYRFGQIPEGLALLPEVDDLAEATRAMLASADHHFFGALTRIAGLSQGQKVPGGRRKIRQHRRMLAGWARSAAVNFRHKHELVEAEWHRVHDQPLKALRGYEQAIESAREHGFVHDQALAEELAADFCEKQELGQMANAFREGAIGLYRRWDAPVLARRLETASEPDSRDNSGADQGWSAPELDLSAFRGALKAIARSQIHSDMMDAVIRGAVTFAGAQSGHLLLPRPDGNLYVEASWDVSTTRPEILQGKALEEVFQLCHAVVHYVHRSHSDLVIDDAQTPQSLLPHLHRDSDVVERKIHSVLCVPLLLDEESENLVGILYLENNATPGAFTQERLETLEIICLAATGRLELSRKAVTDGLTHLYNQAYFLNILETEIQLAQRKRRPLSLIILDIDHFKQFNDDWGHQIGDEVLQKVAETIQNTSRSSDIVARYGGEEFAVILPETQLQQACEAAERLRSAIAAAGFAAGGKQLSLTISIGAAQLDSETDDRETLIRHADNHLYQAKNEGRNCVVG